MARVIGSTFLGVPEIWVILGQEINDLALVRYRTLRVWPSQRK